MANLDTKLPKLVTISTTGVIRIDGAYYKFQPEDNCPKERPLNVWVHGLPATGHYIIDRLICYSGVSPTDNYVGHADRFVKDVGHKQTHGGLREGAGRKPTPRDPDKQLRAVWCWLTESEHHLIEATLSTSERAAILFEAVSAKEMGWDWWNITDEEIEETLKPILEEIRNAQQSS